MKILITLATVILASQISSAHGLHPVIANYNKTIEAAYDYLNHTVGYPETEFDSLVGISTLQDVTRKIRVIKFKFAATNCAKDIEVYAKLDGSAFLANKVVGCAP